MSEICGNVYGNMCGNVWECALTLSISPCVCFMENVRGNMLNMLEYALHYSRALSVCVCVCVCVLLGGVGEGNVLGKC